MSVFSEERSSWEREMLIREAIENAEQGFTVHLRNGARITVSSNSPSIDIIIYGLEKAIRGNHERARMTFIDYLYFWHERLFKLAKRKPRLNH